MRTSISIDDEVAELAGKIATREKRNFSNLIEVALEAYCGPRETTEEHAELIAYANRAGISDSLKAIKAIVRRKSAKGTQSKAA